MINRRISDAGGGGSAGSSGFNWQAGNLSLNPMSKASQPLNGGTVPSPAQRTPTPAPSAPLYGGTVPSPAQATPTQYGYAPALNGGQGINPNAPLSGPAYDPPPVPAGPVQGGREWYNNLDQGGKQAQDAKWLGGDSDYTAQISEYEKALQSFVDRIANQRKGFKEDRDLSIGATDRNQNQSLDNLGEDFGARGLSYSGLFDTSKNEVNTRFNDAKAGIGRMYSQNDSDAVNREKDYRAENAISRGNAERASLSRQAQRQALIDSMGAF